MTYATLQKALFNQADDIALLDPETHRPLERSPLSVAPPCPACGGSGRHYRAFNLTACYSCEHVFQTDLNVTVSYDAEYAHQYDHRPAREMSALRWRFIQMHLDLPVGSNILDIGYGNGAFLKHARAAGMNIFGIDVHSEDFGIPNVTFDTDLCFDLICFFDSLEHFPAFDPIFGLRSHHTIVSIPNTPDLILTRPAAWRHFKPGEHLHYFSRRSLGLVMDAWGFSKLTEGFPEDELRGKLTIDQRSFDNIYTAIYTCAKAQAT